MIIYVKQAFEVTNKDGEKYSAKNGFIGCPPDWVAEDPFFKALCAESKITMHIDNKSVDVEQAKEESKKVEDKKASKK